MSIPSRRVTDAEMAAIADKAVKKIMEERGITQEEFARLVRETQLPLNPARPPGLAVKAERKARSMSRRQLASRAGLSPGFVTALGVSPEDLLQKSGWPHSEEEDQQAQ